MRARLGHNFPGHNTLDKNEAGIVELCARSLIARKRAECLLRFPGSLFAVH
jgi:hypothetical protein